MKNIDDEILFKLVKYHLNKSYHERKDAVIHTGTGLTQPAQWYRDFAQAVIDVALKDLALDAERWRFIIRKLCLSGNGDGTCEMQALNLTARILGWPDVGELAIAQFLDAAIDAAIAAAKEQP